MTRQKAGDKPLSKSMMMDNSKSVISNHTEKTEWMMKILGQMV